MEGYCQDNKHLIIVMEFVSGGELFGYLRGVGRFDKYQATSALIFPIAKYFFVGSTQLK